MERVVEERAGLLFCPVEEALLGHAALPNSACWEEPGRHCHSCAVFLFSLP